MLLKKVFNKKGGAMKNLAKYFDHTNLKPFAIEGDIRKLCEEAKKYGFFSVCIHPCFVKLAKELFKNSDVKVCTVIGFPLGQNTSKVKFWETQQAIEDGADEIDMVINIGALKDKKDKVVKRDIGNVVAVAGGRIVKVIIECCYLTDEEKRRACKLVREADAHFVKTSTGFGPSGATVEDVKLMKQAFGGDVKAAGGIKTLEQVKQFIKAGATRIGASASVEIMEKLEEK